jgi:hypothetical protein
MWQLNKDKETEYISISTDHVTHVIDSLTDDVCEGCMADFNVMLAAPVMREALELAMLADERGAELFKLMEMGADNPLHHDRWSDAKQEAKILRMLALKACAGELEPGATIRGRDGKILAKF